MLVTNQTSQDYWFGPLHLNAGVGEQLTVDDTSDTSLYLTDDTVADAINNLYASGKITVSSARSARRESSRSPRGRRGRGLARRAERQPGHGIEIGHGGNGQYPAANIYNNTTNNGLIDNADGGSGNANDSLDAPAYLVVNYIIKT